MNDKEFNLWYNAFQKIAKNKNPAIPFVHGRPLLEESQIDMYNKIQALLNTRAMESCHQFLYDLDPAELSPLEENRINRLYNLGLNRGFIQEVEDFEEDDAGVSEDDEDTEEAVNEFEMFPPKPGVPATDFAKEESNPASTSPANAFTVLYSAMRNGTVKTGEAYSNAASTSEAKADIVSKLQQAGYSGISILAVEAGDPDMESADSSALAAGLTSYNVPDYSVDEDDYLKDRIHNGHHSMFEADDKEGEEKSDGKDDDKPEDDEADSKKDDAGDEEPADDSDGKEDEEKSDGKDDDKSEDDKEDEEKPDDDTKKKEEDVEEPDEKAKSDDDSDDEDEELPAEEKQKLKDEYKRAFKATLKACGFDKCYFDLSIADRVKFLEKFQDSWGDKPDEPSKFMTDKEIAQLEKIKVASTEEKDDKDSDDDEDDK